ncbi:MAG: DUF3784 domain-containing protein [Sarcina sp.]
MFLISILFLVVGLMVHVFKMYFLISGYNMMTDSQKEDINVQALGRLMGVCCYIISGTFLLAGILNNRYPNFEIIAFGIMIITLLYMMICGRRFYVTGIAYDSEVKFGFVKMLLPSAIVLFVVVYSFGPINVEVQESGLQVEGHFIEYEEMKEIDMIESLPTSKKLFGSGIGSFNKGDFEVEGYEECKLYTSNSDHTIIIETKDETYIFNNGDTKDIYKLLVEKVGNLNNVE